MANVDRHIKWEKHPVQVEVRGSTVIEKGDLVFVDRVDGLRNNGASTANNSVYPFSQIGGTTKTLASNQQLAAENFLGMALEKSFSGITEQLAVATGGHVKYPLRYGKTFSVGEVVMPQGSGTSLFSQKICLWESGSTYALGRTVEEGTRKMYVEFILASTVMGQGIS